MKTLSYILLLLSVSVPVYSAETWYQYVERMALQEAISSTGRTPSAPLPKVYYLNQKDFCKVQPTECRANTAGLFDLRTNAIYINTDKVNIVSVEGQSVLVHEFVHFLQHRTVYTLNECFILEDEAYVTQRRWLKEKGGRLEYIGGVDDSCQR